MLIPWINVRVRFGLASDGSRANPSTFKAMLGKCDVTALFEEVVEGEVVVERRARLTGQPRCPLKTSRQRLRNRLKFKVRAMRDGKGKGRRVADVDKVRFRVAPAANRSPVPDFDLDADTLIEGVPVKLSAARSYDPDGDWLGFVWDLGDGTSASGEVVTHVYTKSQDVTVRLVVSDGQAQVAKERVLPAIPALDPGRTAGILRLSADPRTTLDFGAVRLGDTATRTFTVHNAETEVSTSQVKLIVRAVGDTDAFSVDCGSSGPQCDLGAGEQAEVIVTFGPTAAGHTEAILEFLASASNRNRLHLVTHGFGGSGSMPWGTSVPVFRLGRDGDLLATLPDGNVVPLDVGSGSCLGGSLDGAPCMVDRDCGEGAECGDRSCVDGPNDGQLCSNPSVCPDGTCGIPFAPIDLCADGVGSIFLFNDYVHDDPDWDRDPPQTGMIVRLGVDGTRAIVTNRVTEGSGALGCDRKLNGRVYWAHYDIFGPDFDERERLKSIAKDGSGTSVVHVSNISAQLGDVDPANYIDPDDGYVYYEPSAALRISDEGSERYVANEFGLYRLDPSPLLITTDVTETFSLYPDGSILAVHVAEGSTESAIRIYKIDPDNAANGALSVTDLIPWATTTVPNNRGVCDDVCLPATVITDAAVSPDGVVFLNLYTTGSRGIVPQDLRVQGTIRVVPEGDGTSGTSTGFVDLESLRRLAL